MTYFAFLGWFVGIPLLLLIGATVLDHRRGKALPASLQSWPVRMVMLAHVLTALVYTTPWDNYLVATRVWWYDPALVTGLVIGWVPIEEYTFFVVQTVLTSLWLFWVARRVALPTSAASLTLRKRQAWLIRYGSTIGLGIFWVGAIIVLAVGWRPGTYLALEIAWALPPILFQLAFGADILWHYRRIIGWGLSIPTLYLAASDTIAIGAGTWTIDPTQSTGILIGSLPIEEFIFFLLTNTLVVFGTLLVLAAESQQRAPTALQQWLTRHWGGQKQTIAPIQKVTAGKP